MKWFWIALVCLTAAVLLGWLAAVLVNRRVRARAAGKIRREVGEIPAEDPPRTAIVYGARVYRNDRPSAVLEDRIVAAVELYRAGKVGRLLMSGSENRGRSDEPAAMKRTAVGLGVPEEDILTDRCGRRTYLTCRRAADEFGIGRAVHVTQEFHLPRAIYLAERMGIDSLGLAADRRTYLDERAWARREFLAVLRAWFETNFFAVGSTGGGVRKKNGKGRSGD